MYYQQGDILFFTVDNLPKEGIVQKTDVIASGESGNTHRIADTQKAILYLLGTAVYLKVLEQVKIFHEEHKPIDLPKGFYKVDRVQEFNYDTHEVRNVYD